MTLRIRIWVIVFHLTLACLLISGAHLGAYEYDGFRYPGYPVRYGHGWPIPWIHRQIATFFMGARPLGKAPIEFSRYPTEWISKEAWKSKESTPLLYWTIWAHKPRISLSRQTYITQIGVAPLLVVVLLNACLLYGVWRTMRPWAMGERERLVQWSLFSLFWAMTVISVFYVLVDRGVWQPEHWLACPVLILGTHGWLGILSAYFRPNNESHGADSA